MLSDSFVEAFNSQVNITPNSIKTMTVEQQDRVKANGARAEELLRNKDLALFVHSAKVGIMEQITEITGHSEDDNNRRIALGNQLSGIQNFVQSLQTAVYWKRQLVKQNPAPSDLIQ